jgi:hypothetical protein
MGAAALKRSLAALPSLAAASLVLALLLTACQGTIEAPQLDNPRDPANGKLPPTPTVDAEAQPCIPAIPVTVKVDWQITSTPDLTGFQIYRAASTLEDPGLLVASVAADRRTFTDGASPGVPGLSELTMYWYRVRALGQEGTPGLRSTPDSTTTPECL